ncbi:uncharacterized protein LOC141661122 [Apium graveolens]|uniref:uncharacterized protein LOC141661122 n=1 Tax=Apium graveolens TaxID=4045 RepID=UPI003D797CFF
MPDGYVGSKRYMQQNFQDELAVCRYIGHPDIFLTMTCNSLWDEIQKMMEYVPGCIAPNYPDIISRVFRLKLDQLMVNIKDKKHFGVCIGVIREGIYDPRSMRFAKFKVSMHEDLRCIRHFPKKYCARTTFDDSGFSMYMRRRTNITVEIRKAELDNQWVVPYNRDLLVKYQCHMNVEICCHARSLKYLFKYYLKGHDRVTVHVQRKRKRQANDIDEGGIDEINAYFDGRYLCGAESAYRIFGFHIHHRSISVERLQFHLPGDKNCTFRANEALGKVAAREKNKFSKLEAFFYLNSVDVNARKYTYDEIPQFYVWNDGERKWTMRKRGFQIGRLCYVYHSTEYGLLDDDKEWHEVLTQASAGGLTPQVRQLFVHIIVNCKVTDSKTLWSTHWKSMVDDILLKRRQSCPNTLFTLNDMQLQFYALGEIDELLRSRQAMTPGMEYETAKPLQDCTEEQRKIYDAVIQSIDTNVGGIFFVYGSGGCGKTFLWRTLICKLRSQGKIVLPVASSGIAATLMPGGRTAHSRFKILIVLDECSTCNIAHDSDVAQLIKQTQLIKWDEAPMQHRYAFECLD